LRPPGSRADTLSEATPNETQSDAQSGVVDSSPAKTENESTPAPVTVIRRAKPHSRSTSTRFGVQNQMIQIVESAEGKPVPRKVGEIRYGRSPYRP
jgi:hypothetical protein